MSEPKKSLTEPPTNLKEAIDWVLRVSGGDHHGGFDADRLVKALVKPDDLNINGQNVNIKTLIGTVGNGLSKFIGYKYTGRGYKIEIDGDGIVKSGEVKHNSTPSAYTSAYTGSWYTHVSAGSPQNPTDKEITCARIFFTAIKKIFEGLTALYYNCKAEWKTENLGGSNLKQFMEKNGFSGTEHNTDMTGNQIITKALKDFNEFTTAYNSVGENASLDAFRSQLEQNASTSPSQSPLSTLYILATYVYVRSTSPVTPSFLGYSGTAALAGGAYGLNLGGLGTFMSALLA
ncbi:variant erythrocyte surface antigen-1 family protein [Babesia caballi]|uniref:Variant erythrocyte surface antigen-1 family protein n=1 Tax=Babesia caballi TaxID=5871 RepID=A0AAV4LPT0_BABCB|nr:variant erythrocyte surface antigen-1 family protein [Babesia caballi]